MHWEIHPPRPSRFPSGVDFAPLGPRDFPRASPSGNLSGLGVQNPRPWEISRASGDVFPNISLFSTVYGYNTTLLLHCNSTCDVSQCTLALLGGICSAIGAIGGICSHLKKGICSQRKQHLLLQKALPGGRSVPTPYLLSAALNLQTRKDK